MREYCCKVLKKFITKDKYGAGLSNGRLMISVIQEMSNDLKTCMNIIIWYCPFCGEGIGVNNETTTK